MKGGKQRFLNQAEEEEAGESHLKAGGNCAVAKQAPAPLYKIYPNFWPQ